MGHNIRRMTFTTETRGRYTGQDTGVLGRNGKSDGVEDGSTLLQKQNPPQTTTTTTTTTSLTAPDLVAFVCR